MAHITGFNQSNVHIYNEFGKGQATHKNNEYERSDPFTTSVYAPYYKMLFTATPFYKTILGEKE
jgi:hypothetical protein